MQYIYRPPAGESTILGAKDSFDVRNAFLKLNRYGKAFARNEAPFTDGGCEIGAKSFSYVRRIGMRVERITIGR